MPRDSVVGRLDQRVGRIFRSLHGPDDEFRRPCGRGIERHRFTGWFPVLLDHNLISLFKDDYDQFEYVNFLRESCIVVFTALAQTFTETDEHRRVLQAYFPAMDQLIRVIANSQPPASDSLLAAAISLVGDLINAFGAQIIPFTESEPVNSIIARLRRSRNSKAKTAVNWVSREIQRVRRLAAPTA